MGDTSLLMPKDRDKAVDYSAALKKSEAAIKKAFTKRCRQYGLMVISNELARATGVPDKLVILSSQRVAWIEFKAGDELLYPDQVDVIFEMRRRGQRVEVLRSVEQALDLVDDLARENMRV